MSHQLELFLMLLVVDRNGDICSSESRLLWSISILNSLCSHSASKFHLSLRRDRISFSQASKVLTSMSNDSNCSTESSRIVNSILFTGCAETVTVHSACAPLVSGTCMCAPRHRSTPVVNSEDPQSQILQLVCCL